MANTLVKKRMRVMLIALAILFGGIFAWKGISKILFMVYISRMQQTPTVSTAKVQRLPWPRTQPAVASLRAVRGVDVTTELAGMVQAIYFQPGSRVAAGELLVQLNADSDIATLQALQASTALANTVLLRDTAQYAVHAVSQATLDNDAANLKNLQAQTAAQAATVYKKTILAPFAGQLGISAINLGQYLNPGDKIVTLQQLDPIYADFYVPQQALATLKTGQPVVLTVDTFPGKTFQGVITTINPAIDTNTRNVEVEATLSNPTQQLLPGMFGSVAIDLGPPQPLLTVPVTAVSFNPYGSVVYVVNPDQTVTGKIVTTGEEEGDRVAVLRGLNEGDEIVTAGQLKLKNGVKVTINNTVPLSDSANPTVRNEH